MQYFIFFAVFVLGTIIGSFLNVVIARYNTGFGLNGRSMCFSCGKTLSWFELVPVFSFMAQKGKCRGCSSRISWQYPLIELLTGVVFLMTFMRESHNSIASLLFYLVIFSMLIVIVVYDMRHKIIPDGLVYGFIVLSLGHLFVNLSMIGIAGAPVFIIPSGLDLLAGPALFLPFYLLWFVSKGRWIGLGDGKLALGIGWLLGLLFGGSAIIFAFWIGAIVSVFIILFTNGRIGLQSELPFAPFIILAVFLVYYSHININDVILFFQNYSL